MSPEGNLKTVRGNCHCGAFVYEARLPEVTSYTECNCSICHKKGYAYLVPADGQVDVVKGSIDELATYAFNKGGFVHRFCLNCGTAVLAQKIGDPTAVKTIINVSRNAETIEEWRTVLICLQARTLQDIDFWSLEPKPYVTTESPLNMVVVADQLEGLMARHLGLPTRPSLTRALG